MPSLCLKNEAYTLCSALVARVAYAGSLVTKTRHTQCVARLFLRVAYAGSLLERRTMYIQCVARLFLRVAYAGLCLKNEAYTVCSALVPSRGLCRVFA